MMSVGCPTNAVAFFVLCAVSSLLLGLTLWIHSIVAFAESGCHNYSEFMAPTPPLSMSSRQRSHALPARHLDRANNRHPYRCGIVFFYHVPDTGGASINKWLRKYEKSFNYRYYQHWQLDFKGAEPQSQEVLTVAIQSETKFAQGVGEHVRDLGKSEWRIVHCHTNSLYLNESEALLEGWRDAVERRGCAMVNTVMLREPLNHAMSLHKIALRKNRTREEWLGFLGEPTGRGRWATNLDFFLYNKGRRNPYNVSKEEKVQRAMEILARHFDVITVGDHTSFVNQVLNLTGWGIVPMPYTNVYKGELRFTKKEVQRYLGYLSYLDK
ncbi:hypothetical protein ACHAWF_014713 [Thalassiosira exigua]